MGSRGNGWMKNLFASGSTGAVGRPAAHEVHKATHTIKKSPKGNAILIIASDY